MLEVVWDYDLCKLLTKALLKKDGSEATSVYTLRALPRIARQAALIPSGRLFSYLPISSKIVSICSSVIKWFSRRIIPKDLYGFLVM